MLSGGVSIVILVLVIIAGVYVTKHSGVTTAPQQEDISRLKKVRDVSTPHLLQDVDGDGLKEWEEALWKTDPLNPDTDGDRSLDGDETTHNRNPLKRGPADELFSAFSNLPNAPIQPPSTTQKTTIPFTIDSSKPAPTLPNSERTTNALPTGTVESPEKMALRSYGNAVAKILKTTVGASAEVSAFTAFLQVEPDTSAVIKLQHIGTSYEKRAVLLGQLTVPNEVMSPHALLVSRTHNQAEAIKHIATFPHASEISLGVWQAYTDRVFETGQTIYDMALYFKKQGVAFTSEEDGSLFTLLE